MKNIQILAGFLMLGFVAAGNEYSILWHEGAKTTVLATVGAPTLTPSPAPAPAPSFANVTNLLEVAGPFKTFLGLLESAKLLTVLQAQANDTEKGVTIFAPSDPAFAALRKNTLSNLTDQQKTALLLSHVISKFYTLSDFQNFSNPASTLATGTNGGKYNLNITASSGPVTVSSGYVNAPITSSVYATDPVALYTVGKVLLPEDIFGLPSPSPAPSPAPIAAPPSDLSPSGGHAKTLSSPANAPSDNAGSTNAAAAFLGARQSLSLLLVVAGSLMLL